MSCRTVRDSLSEFLDQRLDGWERTRVAQHLEQCRECAVYLDDLSQTRGGLLNMPGVPVPPRLQTQLQVLASRERSRRLETRTPALTMRSWARRVKLFADNLMRPLALPFAGGVVSALCLFSMLVPTLGFRQIIRNDVPSRLYTAATLVEVAPFGISSDETVVELSVDAKGQATDYSVQQGRMSPEMQADLTKMMVYSRFIPATLFGQPTNGKLLVSFRRMHYVVRG